MHIIPEVAIPIIYAVYGGVAAAFASLRCVRARESAARRLFSWSARWKTS
jgi:hypothetical protein